jgi:hypothetical protein
VPPGVPRASAPVAAALAAVVGGIPAGSLGGTTVARARVAGASVARPTVAGPTVAGATVASAGTVGSAKTESVGIAGRDTSLDAAVGASGPEVGVVSAWHAMAESTRKQTQIPFRTDASPCGPKLLLY